MNGKAYRLLRTIAATIVMGGIGMNANAGFFGIKGDRSWKEEVQLHNGDTLMVERWQSYGGRHEIGQNPPVKEHTLRFNLPGTNKLVEWTSEFGKDIGRTNFKVLALHILNGIPYLVAEPNLCLAYNKWGRPNPPYLLFKYDGRAWQRISMAELPAEFKTLNLIVNSTRERDIDAMSAVRGYVGAADIAKLNGSLTQPQYRAILREAMAVSALCPEMVSDGKGGWLGIDWFSGQKSYEECLDFCKSKEIPLQNCPCDRLFGRK